MRIAIASRRTCYESPLEYKEKKKNRKTKKNTLECNLRERSKRGGRARTNFSRFGRKAIYRKTEFSLRNLSIVDARKFVFTEESEARSPPVYTARDTQILKTRAYIYYIYFYERDVVTTHSL